jgi:putative ATP-binding cassette transporter
MLDIARTQLSAMWQLAAPYFRAREESTVHVGPLGAWTVKEGWVGRALLAAVITAECAQVCLTVWFNYWNAHFFDALQNKDLPVFWQQLIIFAVIGASFMLVSVYQLYLNQWLQIRWRRWMTHAYLDRWLTDGVHYRMRLKGDPADNPDQRIADDIAMFIDQTLSLGVGLLSAVTMLASFGVILWGISSQVPLVIGDHEFAVPGYLVWLAAAFALTATVGAHLIGRRLIGLKFDQQRLGADFRFGLVRLRENSEQVALMGGEAAERGLLSSRFVNIVGNWHAIMRRQKTLTFFTAGYNQIAVILPYAILARPFFTGQIQLGSLMQTAGAFGQVQTSFSFFVNAYARIAEWKAVVDRLSGFETQATLAGLGPQGGGVVMGRGRPEVPLSVADIDVTTPDGTLLLEGTNFSVEAGQTLLLKGPSGCGKTTLLRAICGFWPHSSGSVVVAEGARMLVLPQSPYLPLGSLRAALAYPSEEHAIPDSELRHALAKVGLAELIASLDQVAQWSSILSLGEQQRIGFARAIIARPDVLFLDEATSALDEPSEAFLMRAIRSELPNAAIVSIGHRSSLAALHHWVIDLNQRLALVESA